MFNVDTTPHIQPDFEYVKKNIDSSYGIDSK